MSFMVTRNGVYYDLTQSVYKFKTPDTNMTFVFSSDLHLVKFEERYKKHRIEQHTKFVARYHMDIRFNLLYDIILYKKIENRGFLAFNEHNEKLCLEGLKIYGEKIVPKT